MIPEKVIKGAILNGWFFEHIGIVPHLASLCGKRAEDIVQLEITVAENQELPPAGDNKNFQPDYWAWWDNERQDFSLVYAKRFFLGMCFPFGLKIEEETGRGKAYRVNVKPIDATQPAVAVRQEADFSGREGE